MDNDTFILLNNLPVLNIFYELGQKYKEEMEKTNANNSNNK